MVKTTAVTKYDADDVYRSCFIHQRPQYSRYQEEFLAVEQPRSDDATFGLQIARRHSHSIISGREAPGSH